MSTAEELLFNQPPTAIDNAKRERIYAVVASGKSKHYLGKQLTIDEAQELSDDDIEALHDRYSSLLGSKIVKSLGQSVVTLYSKTLSRYFDIDQDKLYNDLVSDPIVSETLGSFSCRLYFKLGALLGPLAVGLITFNNLIISTNSSNDGNPTRINGETTRNYQSDQTTNNVDQTEESRSDTSWEKISTVK